MTFKPVANKVLETDVLVMGGGIAGCCAAARAAGHGLNVTLAEKSKTDRSGNAGQGIDHYDIFPHETVSPLQILEYWESAQSHINGKGRFTDPNVLYRIFDKGTWAAEELEKLGIPVKWDDGRGYRFTAHIAYAGARTQLRVHWQNIKPLLARAVREKGVNVLERTMIVDLLTNKGAVVGATAINTRTGEFIVIKAKAVVVATGNFARCFDPETPLFWKYKFRYHWCPATVSGDGWAVAYRADAELASMDNTGWLFRARDDLNISYGNFDLNEGIPGRTLTWEGEDLFAHVSASKYAELEQKGKTPLYKNLDPLPDDYHKRVEVAYVDERLVSFKIAEDRGFNPRTHRYELAPNKPLNFQVAPGILTDEDFGASLNGLYAVGDCAAGLTSCGHAIPSAFLAADTLPSFIKYAGESILDEAQVESQKQAALAPLAVKDGTESMELECAVRYICERYVGMFKSEGKLQEGLRRLGSLRRVFLPKLMAKNPHYLMRCLEVRNIMDLAELHIKACLERKETRGNHIRLDYTERDPSRDNMIIIQRTENGKPVLEIRKVPELKPEYAKEGK